MEIFGSVADLQAPADPRVLGKGILAVEFETDIRPETPLVDRTAEFCREGGHRGCRDEGERPAVREGALGAQQVDAVFASEVLLEVLQQRRIVDRQHLAARKLDIDHEGLAIGIAG